MSNADRSFFQSPTNRWLLTLAICGLTACALLASPAVMRKWRLQKREFTFAEVSKQTLDISLIERGRLESQSNVKVASLVEDINGDGILGNAILEIVPNGSHIQEGELLVSLDTGTHIERVDEQILKTDKARAAQISAEVQYQNQISKNATLAAAAELNLRLAKLELEMFKDPSKGTHRLAVDEINRLIDDTENEILAAKASLQLSENDLQGLEKLFQYGYVGKNELERVRLDYLQAQSEVAAKTNRLQTQIASVQKMNVFEKKMQLLTLEGAVNTAGRTLTQVQLNNSAALSAAKTELDRANNVLRKAEQRLARYQWHLDHCTILAPQDGMVAYAQPRHYRQSKIELGATIWEGQTILYLPDLSKMQVETGVHETVRAWVEPNLRATVRLEADPTLEFAGHIETVESMPDRQKWQESDTKIYKTLVIIDDQIPDGQLKPGMTAIVEIHLKPVVDALVVPLESIGYERDDAFCLVERNGRIERVAITLGRSNEHVIQVHDGLSVGERIVSPYEQSEESSDE